MNKTFTLQIFNQFIKTLPVAILVCCILILYPGNANAVSNNNSVDAVQIKSIKCYPNPAISFINFELPTEYINKNYELELYSFSGKKMYEVNVTSAKFTVNFSNDFYRGIYVYQLRDSGGKVIATGKFQVNK